MNRRSERSTLKRWAAIIAPLLFVTVAFVPLTQGADEVSGRVVYHTLKGEAMEAGDLPGHMVGVAQQSGLAFYAKGSANGQFAARMTSLSYDVVKWKGTFTAYVVDTFKDGSTLNFKAAGTTTPVEEGNRVTFEGTYEVTGGTGKFEGSKGKGTFKGERIGPPKTGGDSYVDFTGTEWK